MYELKKDFLRSGHPYRPGGKYEKTSITIHSTGNDKSKETGERLWLDNPENDRTAAWHYCVGEGVVIQAIPEQEESWHCAKAVGNKYSISIETIETGNRARVLMTAAEFVADILKRYGWGIDRLKKHRDWTTKNCPRTMLDKALIVDKMDWNWFIKTVEAFLEGEMVEKIKVIVDGKGIQVDRILKDNFNYIKIRDVADMLGYNIANKGSIPILTKKN